MDTLLTLLGIYVGIGLLVSVVLAYRKSKNPNAVKAIELMGTDFYSSSLGIALLLWPIWIFMQIVEQDTIEPRKEYETKEKVSDLVSLVGRVGRTVTPMIPSGRIRIDEKDYEAITNEGTIDRDDKVEVLSFSMGTLKVKRFQPGSPYNSGQSLRD